MTGTPLNNRKQEEFARARAEGLTIEESAARAGYKSRTGHIHGLSQNPRVKKRIRELQSVGIEETALTIEILFRRITEQAFFDPCVFGEVTTLAELRDNVPEIARRLLVKGWTWDKAGRLQLELVDKDKAIDRLARHLAFYNDTFKIDIGDYGKRLAHARKELGVRD